MRRSIVLSTIVGLGLAASAYAAPVRGKAALAWASGQVERFDQSNKTLVLKQGTHELTFVLTADARVSKGKEVVPANDLASETGHRVKVRYVMEGTHRKASRVEVSERAATSPRAASHGRS